jgi:putative ABC transport system permease protein
MVSALQRKSITDLTRRRARSIFTIASLALAVASIGMLALPTLIDRSMQDEVRSQRLAHLTLELRPLRLSATDLAALAGLPNVAAVEPGSSVEARVLVGERRAPARVLGVRDFARRQVDLVLLESGAAPARGEVLSDVQNANVGLYDGDAGDVVTLVGAGWSVAGRPIESAQLRVTGRGRNLPGGEQVQDGDVVVLYATAETVAALTGEEGYDRLAFRLRDTSPTAAAATVEAVRRYMRTVPGFTRFDDLPELRAPADWPGKADTEAFTEFLTVITVLALLSALVLISNTMTTLVGEQTGEIGIMRAVGARRRQLALVYVRTALLLGALGALLGVALGIALAYFLARYFGSMFWAVDVGLGVDWAVVAASTLVGLLGPPLAALPAIRRGVRVDLREALESTGSAVGGQDAADELLRRIRFLPRTVQIGLRGAGRRRRRSLATALIVALAVGNLLAVVGLAESASRSSQASWGDHLEDIRIGSGTTFGEDALRTIRTTPGVAEAQPALVDGVELAGEPGFVWGVPHEPLLRYRIDEGRWFSAAEERAGERVAVIERNLADFTGTRVGQVVTLTTAGGAARFRIVGLASNQQEEGTALFAPLTTVRSLLGAPTGASDYWIRTTSPDEPLVDRTATLLEDRLAALGYEVGTEITYVEERDELAENRTITTSIAVLGFIVVAISMVGLANAITMSVLERTREIGILRCLGARARDVRRIFATEGVALALAGWLLGIPLGYALHRFLVWLVWEVVDVRLPVAFPAWNVVLALVGTVLLAVAITLLPTRRAARLQPGDALRYA